LKFFSYRIVHKTLFKIESTAKNIDLSISYEAAMMIKAINEDNVTRASIKN
jgi:hypothetical protein